MFSFLRRGRPERSGQMRVSEALEQAGTHAQAGRIDEALSIWEPLAREGVARAQGNIGACFALGQGVERDPDLAKKWLTAAAEHGDVVAQRNLATLLLDEDRAAGAQWYRHAAERGDAISADMIGHMLADGDGVAADPVEARTWLEHAANGGIARAATRLGSMHHDALGGPRDAVAAAHWWLQGAEGGDPDGAAQYGAACHLGHGVARDDAEALAWLTIGRERGSALSPAYLARVEAIVTAEQTLQALARADDLRGTG